MQSSLPHPVGASQQPQPTIRRHWPRIILTALLIVVIAFFVITFVFIPIVFGVMAVSAPRDAVGAAPADFESLTLTAADGVQLTAWYAPPSNGAAIVLVHGASDSREGMRAYADLLQRHGYGVLAYDQRGHGASEGQTNLFGWEGGQDVAAALAFLAQQPDVTAVGGLGLSLGGEVLLGAASAAPTMTAIVSEGASHRSMAEFRALASHANPVSGLQPWVTYTTVALLTGDQPPTAIVDSIRATQTTRYLVIAAEDTADEAEFGAAFAAAAPGRSELWVVPDATHTSGLRTAPEEYERRVIDFFDAALLPA